MKPIRSLLPLFIVALALTMPVKAVSDIQTSQAKAYGVPELEQSPPEEAYQIWGNITVSDAAKPQTLLQMLWAQLTGSTGEIVRSALQNAASILLLCFLIAVIQTMPLEGGHAQLCSIIGAVSVSMLCTHEAASCIPQGFHVIETLTSFSDKLLPALCAAAAAGGAFTSAGAKYAVSSLTLSLLISVMTNLIRPLLFLYISAVIAGNVFQNTIMISVTTLLKRLLRLFLIGTAVVFTGYLTLTGVLSGAVDATAAKAAKATISTALPVVGSMLSDAAGTLISGAGILRAGIGSLGVLCTLSVCALPYVSLGVHFLIYQCISGFCSAFSDKRISGLLHGFSDVYAILLGTAGTVTFVLFASIVSLMRAVNG